VSMALVSHARVPNHEWKSLVGIGRGEEVKRKKEEQKERKVVERDVSVALLNNKHSHFNGRGDFAADLCYPCHA
jgi:hypothetical protein